MYLNVFVAVVASHTKENNSYETATGFFNSTAIFSVGALTIVMADNTKLSITKVLAGFINGK
jgi:hypothetical protein